MIELSGIYKIICKNNNKFYIGSSINIDRRLKDHINLLKRNKHSNKYLQNAWNKYGEKNFRYEIIETVYNIKQLLTKEQQWIDYTECCKKEIGFNISVNSSAPNMGVFIDLIGKKFNRLFVMELYSKNPTKWLCKCDCGNEKIIRGDHLLTNKVKSCGCLRKEITNKNFELGWRTNITHGRSKTIIYAIWRRIINRCNNPKYHAYKNYGGKGIGVCYRWSNKNPIGFENFFEDMGEQPTNKHQIGRKNNTGDYCPENCVWVLSKENRRNRNNTHWLKYKNEKLCTSAMADKYNINRRTLVERLSRGLSIKEALTTPVRRKKYIL